LQPRLSLGAQRALARAALRAESAGRDEVRGADLLVAMYDEPDSYAVDMLEAEGVTRLDIVSYLAHGVSKLHVVPGEAVSPAGAEDDEDAPERTPRGDDALSSFTQDLTALARRGAIDPL